ncbi:apolipoprotein N-acyltransferase [Rhodosalinus sp. 5P4]|uniref:apolipoprotein N-acyltransferase n=1 Tax=Rhodosalinus sp. 5P4 TaxID=3239196 RepID=UPI00352374D2
MAEGARPRPGAAALSFRPRLGLGLVAGAGAALGQAPFGLWPLTLLGFAALALLWSRAGAPRRAALVAWVFGLGHFALALHWIVEPFFVDAARDGWMAPFALAFLAGGLALFWGAAGWIAARLRAGAVGLVAALCLSELARAYLLTGFPWAMPGHAFIGTPVMQWAAWIGPHGLTLATLALAMLPAALFGAGRRASALVVAAGALAVLWGGGLARLSQPLPEPTPHTVRLIQPNAPQRQKWDPEHIPVFYARQVSFTMAAPRPDLVVWPETALPDLLERAEAPLAHIAEAAGGAGVVLGIQRSEAGRYYNSAVFLDAGGRTADVYDKHHLVPFGEYMPWPAFWRRLGIHGLAARADGGYTPGPGPRLLDTGPLGSALPLICYEAVFPQDVGGAPERPDYLLHLTNDAWFGTFSGPYQHLAQARLRAVEQGLPLMRAANTGVSAAIDARGAVLSEIALGQAGYIDVALPEALPPTPYARLGDWPAAPALFALFAIAARRARGKTD